MNVLLVARFNLFIFLVLALNPIAFAADTKGLVNRTPQSQITPLQPCEINFVKFLNGKLPASMSGSNKINLWDQLFDTEAFADNIAKIKTQPKRLVVLKELIALVDRDKVFTDNLAEVATILFERKILTKFDLERLFIKADFEHARFFFSDKTKKLTSQVNIDQVKVDVIERLINSSELSVSRANEYRNILLQSNRTAQEIELAISSGMILHNSDKHLTQFREYFDYLNVMQKHKVNKALSGIEKIYDFGYRHSVITISSVLPPYKQFLVQRSKTLSYEQRRYKQILKELKLSERTQLTEEIQELARREARGQMISAKEARRLERRLDSVELSESLKKRARRQAYGEKEIFRKLLNGCGGGDNPRVKLAAKKFKNFKVGLALTTTPLFYIMKNWDKREKDPYFWEKLGYEMVTGLAFTFVANKIMTNSNTSFLRKYVEGYVKFGIMDGVINGIGYEQMFGANEHIRYFQRLYRPDVPESDLDRELKELMASPTFEKDVKELMSYLEEQSKRVNLKNWLENLFGYGGYNDIDGEFKISQEDLESPEAKEMMMELLAERMYLENMGSWPILQSGNSGADRWMFFRMRNVVWDIKRVAVNLAIFQVMCREPFGKIGSWLAVLSIVVGDSMLSGNLSYGLRREAINQ